MTSSGNPSSRTSPRKKRGIPNKRGGVSNNGASNSRSRTAGVHVAKGGKMAKKVFVPSKNNITGKSKRGRPVGSLNKRTIKKRLMLAGQHKSRAEGGTPLSKSQTSLDGSGDDLHQDKCTPHKNTGSVKDE